MVGSSGLTEFVSGLRKRSLMQVFWLGFEFVVLGAGVVVFILEVLKK